LLSDKNQAWERARGFLYYGDHKVKHPQSNDSLIILFRFGIQSNVVADEFKQPLINAINAVQKQKSGSSIVFSLVYCNYPSDHERVTFMKSKSSESVVPNPGTLSLVRLDFTESQLVSVMQELQIEHLPTKEAIEVNGSSALVKC
jgi:hypothetical protein